MGNGSYPTPQPPQKHHWTTTPGFWVSVLIMIFAGIAAFPVIRDKFWPSNNLSHGSNSLSPLNSNTGGLPPDDNTGSLPTNYSTNSIIPPNNTGGIPMGSQGSLNGSNSK